MGVFFGCSPAEVNDTSYSQIFICILVGEFFFRQEKYILRIKRKSNEYQLFQVTELHNNGKGWIL